VFGFRRPETAEDRGREFHRLDGRAKDPRPHGPEVRSSHRGRGRVRLRVARHPSVGQDVALPRGQGYVSGEGFEDLED